MRPDTSHWRDGRRYEFFDTLSVEGLAWECLRRFERYQEHYGELVAMKAEDHPYSTDAQRHWGCDFPARPSLSALRQDVLWSPLANPAVLLADDAPEFLPPSPSPSPAVSAAVRPSPEGLHAIHRGGIVAQILLLSGRKTDRASAVILPLDDNLPDRVEAVLRLWQALNARPVTRDGRITPYQRRRIRLMMRAADGRANGATYREIALALFGPERVAAEPWKTSPLRDAVIGLVESAGPLINGGYRKLLRHRRRS